MGQLLYYFFVLVIFCPCLHGLRDAVACGYREDSFILSTLLHSMCRISPEARRKLAASLKDIITAKETYFHVFKRFYSFDWSKVCLETNGLKTYSQLSSYTSSLDNWLRVSLLLCFPSGKIKKNWKLLSSWTLYETKTYVQLKYTKFHPKRTRARGLASPKSTRSSSNVYIT